MMKVTKSPVREPYRQIEVPFPPLRGFDDFAEALENVPWKPVVFTLSIDERTVVTLQDLYLWEKLIERLQSRYCSLQLVPGAHQIRVVCVETDRVPVNLITKTYNFIRSVFGLNGS